MKQKIIMKNSEKELAEGSLPNHSQILSILNQLSLQVDAIEYSKHMFKLTLWVWEVVSISITKKLPFIQPPMSKGQENWTLKATIFES